MQAVGLTDTLPLGKNRTWGAAAKGQVYERSNYPLAFVRIVTDGYVGAMGIPLVAGRDFSEHDSASSQPVIIVNESLADRLWPGEDPLGKIMRTDRPERQVIGVVQNVRHLALEKESGNEMYLPLRQTNDFGSVDVVVRGPRSAEDLAAEVRASLRPLDPTLPANGARTLQELVDRSVSPRRFVVLLLTAFAAFAVALAALGIYGVISYSVSQKKQEIGVRMALGASAAEVRKRILLQTLRLAAMGMALGIASAWVLSRMVQSLLFDVTPTDPVTFAAVVVVLGAVAGLAGYLPARRASRLSPMDALRVT